MKTIEIGGNAKDENKLENAEGQQLWKYKLK